MDLRNLVPLPPKRFEPVDDPAYDPLRHHLWFKKLERRRTKIPKIIEADRALDSGATAIDAARQFGIDARELRSYRLYVGGASMVMPIHRPKFQQMLDSAYESYCAARGNRAFSWCLKKVAILYGVKPKKLQEVWDVEAGFYPSQINM